MKILPYDSFTLVTALSPDEIAARLAPQVREPKLIRFSFGPLSKKPATPYEGRVSREGFKIWPAIRYRNSFLPIIVGRYEPHFSGMKVAVTQRLHLAVLAFLAIWIAGFASVWLVLSGAGEFDGMRLPFDPALIPYLAAGFIWLITTGGFWWEARHTREKLSNILAAQLDDGF